MACGTSCCGDRRTEGTSAYGSRHSLNTPPIQWGNETLLIPFRGFAVLKADVVVDSEELKRTMTNQG